MNRCPKCGASLSVRRKDGISVCQYCDSSFSNQYLDALYALQLENSKPVRKKPQVEYASGPTADRLIQNGETNITLRDFGAAFANFEQATKSFPEDYRGWFGCARASTQDFTILGNHSKVEHWYGYVTQLASKGQLLQCNAKYADYLKLRAEADAEADLNSISQLKSTMETEISAHKNQITRLHKAHAETIERKTACVNIAKAALEKAERQSSRDSIGRMFVLILGICLSLFTLWLTFEAVFGPADELIINIIAWIIISVLAYWSFLLIDCGRNKSAEVAEEKARKEYETAKREARAVQSASVDEKPYEDGIQQCIQTIAKCEQYLAKKAKVLEYHRAKRLKEIDASISLSGFSSLIKCRNQIYSNKTVE